MPIIDTDKAVRDRAYEIWEREGRPSGREHEHWAQAAREIEGGPQADRKENPKDAGNPKVTGDVRAA